MDLDPNEQPNRSYVGGITTEGSCGLGDASDRAEEAYRQERPTRLIVIPEDVAFPAYELAVRQLPSFSGLCGDVYVWPPDHAWTMAFTHEESDGVGPYFSRREWAA
jgi:hypothetical protein